MGERLIRLLDDGRRLRVRAERAELLRYVYRPAMPADHSPRPYLHPVRTRHGVVVTDAAPADHPWHYGISLAIPLVGETSFWGGPTYRHDAGYVPLANHGRVVHRRWLSRHAARMSATLAHELSWRDRHGQPLLAELRRLVIRLEGADAWSLGLSFVLRNVSGMPLTIGSPGAAGRTGAGYGGLFLRAALAFRAGRFGDAGGTADDMLLGTRSPAVALEALGARVVLRGDAAVDEPWFVRHAEYPGVGPALAFAEPLIVPPAGVLRRRYQLCISDRTV